MIQLILFLIGRRVNSRAIEEDMRVIHKALNKNYIYDINDYEIIDVLIVIARGIIQATLEKIVIILKYMI